MEQRVFHLPPLISTYIDQEALKAPGDASQFIEFAVGLVAGAQFWLDRSPGGVLVHRHSDLSLGSLCLYGIAANQRPVGQTKNEVPHYQLDRSFTVAPDDPPHLWLV